ncbi:MAG: radical SAM protein [Candidatus Omnitrophica bacterium]|nr:radical SAM protein [Candidatus Omnitrophota bacterium]
MSLDTLPQTSYQIKRLDLKVGYSCINDCRFCVVADKRIYPDKTTEQIKWELEEAYSNRARQVVFTGGECTTREDIFEIVKFAKNIGYWIVQIQTNGRKFSSTDFCKKMLLAGMNEFGPALHGHTPELHDFLTKREGSFRQTVLGIHNIKKITKGKINILTNTVVTKYNYNALPQIASLLIKLGVNQYQFAFVHALGNANISFKDIVPKKTDMLPYLKKGLDLGVRKGVKVRAEAVPLCLMKGYENFVSEFYIPSTEMREMGLTIERFEDVRREKAKVKFPQCRICKYDDVCEGPWKEYSQYYGDEEFQPVID